MNDALHRRRPFATYLCDTKQQGHRVDRGFRFCAPMRLNAHKIEILSLIHWFPFLRRN
jgi:hypothetical protein